MQKSAAEKKGNCEKIEKCAIQDNNVSITRKRVKMTHFIFIYFLLWYSIWSQQSFLLKIQLNCTTDTKKKWVKKVIMMQCKHHTATTHKCNCGSLASIINAATFFLWSDSEGGPSPASMPSSPCRLYTQSSDFSTLDRSWSRSDLICL